MTIYQDIADKTEDERIRQIGEIVMSRGAIVAFMVDDEPGNPERYIRKLLKQFPSVRITERFKGPIPHVITIKCGPIGTNHASYN